MRCRCPRPVAAALTCALFCVGCGGNLYTPASAPEKEPFVAKGKLKAEMDAKNALKKQGKSVPAR